MDPSAVSMKALERAVAVVNRIITKSAVKKVGNSDTTAKGKAKWTKISAKARGQTHVKELDRADKSLADYLALPVEEYSLLDPSWITREPNSNVFCLSAPVRGITGVDLEPKVWITVDVDEEKGTVTFHSDRACTGDANMDGRLQLSFEGTLWHKPASKQAPPGRFNPWRKAGNRSQERVKGSQVPAAHLTSGNGSLARQGSTAENEATATDQPASVAVLQHSAHNSDVSLSSSQDTVSVGAAAARSVVIAELEAEPSSSSTREYSFTALASPEEDGDRATAGSSSTLHANARVWASVKLGPPLNVVPGFLISYTGGLIATAVLQALMPTVLELLGRDYETWAAGGGRKALR